MYYRYLNHTGIPTIMTTPTFTLSRADSDRRVNDFPCPEGGNSVRWTISIAGTTDEFIANWEPAAGHESFITSILMASLGIFMKIQQAK